MNSNLITLLVAACFVNFICAAVLPDFVTPCKGNDPNLNECATNEANKIIPTLVKGYPKLNIPVLAPLSIPEIKIENTGQLDIIFRNVIINGLEETKALSFNIDLKSHNIGLKLAIPFLNAPSEYEVNGRILVLPITGKGPGNVTAVDGVYDIDISYTLYDKDGVEYAKMENADVEIELKRLSISLENLFDGNKELGDAANAALNKEWRQLLKELKPALKATFSAIILQVCNGILDKVPFADIFGGVLP